MAGRHRTCAPRVSGGRSTVLSYSHTEWAELDRPELRDEDSNPDFHVQSVASSRLDDPGLRLADVSPGAKAERCCPCHSPTLRPWIAAARRARRLTSSYVEEFWSPYPRHSALNSQAKADAYSPSAFQRGTLRSLSLSGGASIRFSAFQAGHHLLIRPPQQPKRRPVWVALDWLVMRLAG